MASLTDRLTLAARALVGLFDDRSANAAYGLLPGISPGAIGASPVRGTRQALEGYSKMPWLRAASNRVGSSFASVEWKLYTAGKPGKKAIRDRGLQRAGYLERKQLIRQKQQTADLQEIESHILLDGLDGTGGYHTGVSLRKTTMIHLDLTGEAFWVKERNGAGAPITFYPIPPNWVTATPTPEHRFYRVDFRGWQGEIPDTEVLWFCDPDPANPYGRGSGLALSLGDELDIGEYASKYIRQFFANNARPDILISPKGENATMVPAETLRLEQRWTDSLQGFWRAFKPFFMSRPVEVTMFEQSHFDKMQMSELRKAERDTILHVWGLPPEIFGILESSNRSTIDAAWYLMSLVVLVPRLEFFRSVLQERLIPEYDERLILDYVSPVSEDREFILKAAQIAPWAPNVDEWRDMMGRPPLENGAGKVHMVPINLTAMVNIAEPPPPPEPIIIPSPIPPEPAPVGGKGRR